MAGLHTRGHKVELARPKLVRGQARAALGDKQRARVAPEKESNFQTPRLEFQPELLSRKFCATALPSLRDWVEIHGKAHPSILKAPENLKADGYVADAHARLEESALGGVWPFILESVLVLAVMLYGMLLMVLGPRRLHRLLSNVLDAVFCGTVRLTKRISQILALTLINTMTLFVRLGVSGGRRDLVTEAWAKYLERMADVIFKV